MRDTVRSVGVVCPNNPLHVIVLKLFPLCTELKWEELDNFHIQQKLLFIFAFWP